MSTQGALQRRVPPESRVSISAKTTGASGKKTHSTHHVAASHQEKQTKSQDFLEIPLFNPAAHRDN